VVIADPYAVWSQQEKAHDDFQESLLMEQRSNF
jgi:hypothetical protein